MSEPFITAEELKLNLDILHISYLGNHKGITLETPDKLTISVQWGNTSYCSNRFMELHYLDQKQWMQTTNAEVCMWWTETNVTYMPESWDFDTQNKYSVAGWVPCIIILEAIKYLYGETNVGTRTCKESGTDVCGRDNRSLRKEEILQLSR